MKIQIIAPVQGKKWIVGHTVLVDDEIGQQLINEGVAIVHPTITDPAPTHPCPCEDESNDEPCEECQEQAAQIEIESDPAPKKSRRKAKNTSIPNE